MVASLVRTAGFLKGVTDCLFPAKRKKNGTFQGNSRPSDFLLGVPLANVTQESRQSYYRAGLVRSVCRAERGGGSAGALVGTRGLRNFAYLCPGPQLQISLHTADPAGKS